jgi:hypothetical protein
LGDLSEREETTDYAREKINLFLKNKEYHLALLIAYIYAGIRLRSLLTDWIKPQINEPKDNKWKKTAEIFKSLTFYGLLKNCEKLGLLVNDEFKTLDDLREKRNNVAHESRTWKNGIDLAEENKIKRICKSVIAFLDRTNLSQ